jgi:hypothetical protein
MENEKIVTNINLNGRYKVSFEQAASTKGQLGFKIEANGDNMAQTFDDAKALLEKARACAPEIKPEAK